MHDQSPSVAAERIRLLYRQMPLVLTANGLNAALIVAALWDPMLTYRLLGWVALLALVTVLRAGLWGWYLRSGPADVAAMGWGRTYTLGSALSGLLWGLSAPLFITPEAPSTLLLIAFVIGGMAAGAVTAQSYHLPAFYAYLGTSLTPLAALLAVEGSRVTLAMAALTLVFGVGLVLIGRNFHASITRQFVLAAENRSLLADLERQVHERTEDLQAANDRLREEVAERRRLAEEVASQAAHLDGILSTIDDHVFMIDRSGALLYASRSVLRDFGIDGGSVQGIRWTDLGLPGDEAETLEALQRRLMETGKAVTGEVTHAAPGEPRRWEYKFNPMVAPDGRIRAITAVARDVTERQRYESALQEARAEAEQADQAKSRFLAAASHDLRQPMQSIILFAGALRARLTDPRSHEVLSLLERGLDTLKELLDSLLDVSRLDVNVIQAHVTDVPLGRLMEEIAAAYAPVTASKGIDLHLDNGCDLLVRSDPNLLGRMVRNLVENAVRYTNEGSILLDCRREDDCALIQVRDTGIGIAADQLERIFEEFHQVGNPDRDKAQGMGLGLSIVQRLSGILDHPVTVQSEPGRGSVFSIRVPLAPAATTEPVELTAAEPPASGTKLVVLVDDDVIVLLGLRASLQEWAYETVIASSTEQALERLAGVQRPPDLIMADYRLAGGKLGTEAILKIRERFGTKVPGIILTGEMGADCTRDADTHGLGIIHKPVTPRQLAAAIGKLVGPEASPIPSPPSLGRRLGEG